MKLASLLLLAVFSSLGYGQAKQAEAERIFAAASPSALIVEAGDSVGSGFVFSSPDTVVTCFHVVEGAKSIRVRDASGRSWNVAGVRFDKTADIAVLRLSVPTGLRPLASNSSEPKVGQRAYVIGTPLGLLTNTLSEGLVSGVRMDGGIDLVQFSASVSPGSSGGPVLDSDGRVIGVVSFTLSDGQSLNMSVGMKTTKDTLLLPELSVAAFGSVRGKSKMPTEMFEPVERLFELLIMKGYDSPPDDMLKLWRNASDLWIELQDDPGSTEWDVSGEFRAAYTGLLLALSESIELSQAYQEAYAARSIPEMGRIAVDTLECNRLFQPLELQLIKVLYQQGYDTYLRLKPIQHMYVYNA